MELDYKSDCCFSDDNYWFRYRAAAIIIEDDCVLMASNDVSSYFYSVGGGVHLGENAEDAVIREVFEETGVNYKIDRLAVIHENFFLDKTIAQSKRCHEITFYFLMKSKGNKQLNSNSICLHGKEYMNWLPIHTLGDKIVYPTFFKNLLIDLPKELTHIVTREY